MHYLRQADRLDTLTTVDDRLVELEEIDLIGRRLVAGRGRCIDLDVR